MYDIDQVIDLLVSLFASPNIYDSVLGIIPLSTYLSAPPVIVNVFPEPV